MGHSLFSHDIIRVQLGGGGTCWRQWCEGVSVREVDRQTDRVGASFTLELCCVSDVVNICWL